MACLDVLNQDNYLNVNITLAKLFGLQTAVYWAELSRVLSRVKTKETFDENGYFNLDRNYIQKMTTLSVEEQIRCDQVLTAAGVLMTDPENADRVRVDAKLILSLIISGDVAEVAEQAKTIVKKTTKKGKSTAKLEGIKSNMKRYITEPDESLVKEYYAWIDVIAAARRINKVAVESFQKTIKEFTTDKEIQAEIIKIATTHTYIDAQWAISVYNGMNKNKATSLKLAPQKVGTTVNDDLTF